MKKALLFVLGAVFTISSGAQTFPTFHDYSGATITEDTIDFSAYYGKKVMVVNTASYCVFTHQYTDLETLYEDYNQYDFEIIGFPCNDFSGQEPHSDSTIQDFCNSYNVTFQMMSKIATISADTAPVYQWLQRADLNGVSDASVSWNFNKFLIDEAGHWVRHIESAVSPLDTSITNWIMTASVLGLESNSVSVEPVVFPNPSSRLITISYQLPNAGNVIVSCTDITGKLMFSIQDEKQAGVNKTVIDRADFKLSAGIYSLKIETPAQSFNRKLVITD